MKIGVLALQGAFAKHIQMLDRLGVAHQEVRTPADLVGIDGLILPGGESTTMLRLMQDEALLEPLQEFAQHHPTFGTCAGAILLAHEVTHPAQPSLDIIDIGIERNSYGRQIDSFSQTVPAPALGSDTPLELIFIRAPGIFRVGAEVQVLATCQEKPVLVASSQCLVATFHPELTSDTRIHNYFLAMVARATHP